MGLTDEELVEQIKENPYLQPSPWRHFAPAPFDPLMVCISEAAAGITVNDCKNESYVTVLT